MRNSFVFFASRRPLRLTAGLVLVVFGLLFTGCSQHAPVPQAALNPTDFLATRIPRVLTENAATQTVTVVAFAETPPAHTLTLPVRKMTLTAVPTAANRLPTVTPSATLTASPTPHPTIHLSFFNTPPPTPEATLEPHFYFEERPVGAGANGFIASTYRYGATANHRFKPHHGVDLGNPQGTPLTAVAAGTIYYAGNDAELAFGPNLNFYGNLVIIRLAQTWQEHIVYALYGHLDQIAVQTGQAINAGDFIGTVGATGIARGPHLHLEVRLDHPEDYDATRNPELWLRPIEEHGALAVRVTNEDGLYLPGMRIGIMCADGAYRYLDTYWDGLVNPDEAYGENAAMTDMPAGRCRLETVYAGRTLQAAVEIKAGAVTFVWLKP